MVARDCYKLTNIFRRSTLFAPMMIALRSEYNSLKAVSSKALCLLKFTMNSNTSTMYF